MPNVISTRLYGAQLALAVADTDAPTVFTAVLRTEITSMRLTNVAADGSGTAKVYHLPKDATQGDGHLVYHGASTNEASASEGAGITLEIGDTIGAEASAATSLVLTLYGTTESITGV